VVARPLGRPPAGANLSDSRAGPYLSPRTPVPHAGRGEQKTRHDRRAAPSPTEPHPLTARGPERIVLASFINARLATTGAIFLFGGWCPCHCVVVGNSSRPAWFCGKFARFGLTSPGGPCGLAKDGAKIRNKPMRPQFMRLHRAIESPNRSLRPVDRWRTKHNRPIRPKSANRPLVGVRSFDLDASRRPHQSGPGPALQ